MSLLNFNSQCSLKMQAQLNYGINDVMELFIWIF